MLMGMVCTLRELANAFGFNFGRWTVTGAYSPHNTSQDICSK